MQHCVHQLVSEIFSIDDQLTPAYILIIIFGYSPSYVSGLIGDTQDVWWKNVDYYRPQQSCEGYVFTGVCLSTGGGGVCLSACWDTTPPQGADTPLGADTPKSRHPPGADTPREQTHPPEQTPPQSRHPREQTPPRADLPEQTPPLGVDTPPPRADTPLRYGHCWGRYASYWNAFLFLQLFCWWWGPHTWKKRSPCRNVGFMLCWGSHAWMFSAKGHQAWMLIGYK